MIKFSARFCAVQKGRIYFTNKKVGNSNAAAMVFDLQSNVTDRINLNTWTTSAKLYTLEDQVISVKNNFDNNGKFYINLEHVKIINTIANKKATVSKTKVKRKSTE